MLGVSIHWHFKLNENIKGNGEPILNLKEASEWISYLNSKFPEIHHFIVADVP